MRLEALHSSDAKEPSLMRFSISHFRSCTVYNGTTKVNLQISGFFGPPSWPAVQIRRNGTTPQNFSVQKNTKAYGKQIAALHFFFI